MDELIKLEDFASKVIDVAQGERNERQFALEMGIVRQTLRNVRFGVYLPNREIVEKFGYELVCRPRKAARKKAAKRSK